MIQNYIQLAFRNLRKNQLFTLVNFTGLAIGLTFCFLTLAWWRFEHSYDHFYPTADRLYRMNYHVGFTGADMKLSRCPSLLGPILPTYFPEIEAASRMYPRSLSVRNAGNDTDIELEDVLFADSTAQQVFGFDFLHGDPATALFDPFTVLLTDETALRLFNKSNVLGEKLMLAGTGPFTVAGVIRKLPENAHLRFEMLVPYRNLYDVEPENARENLRKILGVNRLASHSYTYALLREGADVAKVNAKFPDFVQENGEPKVKDKQGFSLFPVRDIHLASTNDDEPVPPADPLWLRAFLISGLFILAIAAINFINLSTATQLNRIKEVSMRKVLGAARAQIIGQLLGETFLLGLLAFLTALLATYLAFPRFTNLLGQQVDRSFLTTNQLPLSFAGIFLSIVLLAGVYPAIFGSRFNPMGLIRKQQYATGGSMGGWIGKTLITLQFAVAVVLTAGTIIILQQVDYLRNFPMGFDRELVLEVPLFSPNMNSLFAPGDPQLRSKTNAFEDKLLQNSAVKAVTMGTNLPGQGAVRHPVATSKIRIEDGNMLPILSVDYDFTETFGLKIVAGRDFDKSFGTDHQIGYILSESAVKSLGFEGNEQSIGQMVHRGGKPPGQVVGVVADFHFESVRNAINPFMMEVNPGSFTAFGIKINNANVPETMAFIERTWREFFPEKVFEGQFLSDNIQDSFAAEGRLSRMIGLFAAVAIFLSCFGLFGLITFAVRAKTREIGIRKVLGASVASIAQLLMRDYLLLVALAVVVATPLAWYALQQWLDDFAHHIDIKVWMFMLAGVVAIVIALLTLSIQSMKAALVNPTKSIRSE
jgi:putative ABC transport system permease protein